VLELKVKRKWFYFTIITLVCFAFDMLTKYLAVASLHGRPPFRIAGRFIQFLLVYNKGALFGFDPRRYLPSFPLNAFFFIFSILAIVVIVAYYKTLRDSDTAMKWGLTLILPGALGNLLDRILHPGLGVVDFIRIGVSDTLYWPIFNMADVYVTVGVGLIFINFLQEEFSRKRHGIPLESPSTNNPD
jgi:signal peptidase II